MAYNHPMQDTQIKDLSPHSMQDTYAWLFADYYLGAYLYAGYTPAVAAFIAEQIGIPLAFHNAKFPQ